MQVNRAGAIRNTRTILLVDNKIEEETKHWRTRLQFDHIVWESPKVRHV